MKSAMRRFVTGIMMICLLFAISGTVQAAGRKADKRETASLPVAKTTANLNMRSSMSTKNSDNIILTIPKGYVAEILGTPTESWFKVKYNGYTGYAKQKYLKVFTPEWKATTARLRLRSSKNKDISSNIILVIPKGKKVEVLRNDTNGWVQVRYNGKIGYVMGTYLSGGEVHQYFKTTDRLNLRTSTDTSSQANIILTIPKGKTVELLSKKSSKWWYVKYKSKKGYVSCKYLTPVDAQRVVG